MIVDLPAASRELLADLRRYLDGLDLAAAQWEYDLDELEPGPASLALLRRLAGDGWAGIDWPERYGGRGRSALDQWLLAEELASRRLYSGGLSMSSIGPAILRYGDERQRVCYAMPILSTDVIMGVGYTEPDAGSDLAALRTSARRDGDHYVVTGHKVYTTVANLATHLWLAVRTGSSEEGNRGLSVLVVPAGAPGVEIRPMFTQARGRTNEVYLDEVVVPLGDRVGAEGEGWDVIRYALDRERLFPTSGVLAQFERLVRWCASSQLLEDRACRADLARLAMDVEVAQHHSALRLSADLLAGGPGVAASMSKVWVTECRERVGSLALGMMGERGQLVMGAPGAPSDGVFERVHTAATMRKFAGGANEVQRDLVARRELRLPSPGLLETDVLALWSGGELHPVVKVARDLGQARRSDPPEAPGSTVSWPELVELGWLEVGLAEPPDGGLRAAGAILAELGRAGVRSDLGSALAAVLLLGRVGAAGVLTSIVGGDRATAAVIEEPATVMAEPAADGFRLRAGAQILVERLDGAAWLVLLVPAAAGGSLLCALPREVLGASSASVTAVGAGTPTVPAVGAGTPTMVIDGEPVTALDLDGVVVPASSVLGCLVPEEAVTAAELVRVLRAAELCGIATRAAQMTVAHVADRHQFGRPLGVLQAVRHRCADMYMDTLGATLLVWAALGAAETHRPAIREMVLASCCAGDAAERVVAGASQLHGGVGFMAEHPLPDLFRRVKAQRLRMGPLHRQLERVATWAVDPVTRGTGPSWLREAVGADAAREHSVESKEG